MLDGEGPHEERLTGILKLWAQPSSNASRGSSRRRRAPRRETLARGRDGDSARSRRDVATRAFCY